jgi:hypothetical protein
MTLFPGGRSSKSDVQEVFRGGLSELEEEADAEDEENEEEDEEQEGVEVDAFVVNPLRAHERALYYSGVCP